jgi:DnaK suppressor protein
MDTNRLGTGDTVLDAARERRRLEEELAEAYEELALIELKLEDKGDFGLGEGASTAYEWEMNLALRQAAEAKIGSIKAAMNRLERGVYGICRVCGQPIDPDRLEILPDTTLCVTCARLTRYLTAN